MESTIEKISTNKWDLGNIFISHNMIDYHSFGKHVAANDSDFVRLHFGLQGKYSFNYRQLNTSFQLSGHHNNIMYSDGLELEIFNESQRIETFGINFTREAFIEIAQNGNEPLKRLSDKVLNKQDAILSPEWKTNNFRIQQVIQQIINNEYSADLRDLFLLSKSIELLVLQAELYEQPISTQFIKSPKDRDTLITAKELLNSRLEQPPTISELSKLIGMNEYKLKRGFKELFGLTVFGFIHQSRMCLAKKLLLGTAKTAKEIAYEIGYSSPQHFSKAFKKEFGTAPNSIRTAPDSTID